MEMVAFSVKPLAMTTGIHTLKRLHKPGAYEYFDSISNEFVIGILDAGKKTGHAICGGCINGMFGFFFTEDLFITSTMQRKVILLNLQGFFIWKCWRKECTWLGRHSRLALPASEDIQRTIDAAEEVLGQI
ncbi:hypothetical protein ACFE04_028415 [Oxalis oulophora]